VPTHRMACRETSECPPASVCGRVVLDSCYYCPLGEECSCLSAEKSVLCVGEPCDTPTPSGPEHVPCRLLDAPQCAAAPHCYASPPGSCDDVPCVRLRTQPSCERAGCSWGEALQLCAPSVQIREAASREACAALAYRNGYACFAAQLQERAPGICLLASAARAGDADWQRSYCPRGYRDEEADGGCAPLRAAGVSANAGKGESHLP
jgi:hypothetical protein